MEPITKSLNVGSDGGLESTFIQLKYSETQDVDETYGNLNVHFCTEGPSGLEIDLNLYSMDAEEIRKIANALYEVAIKIDDAKP